MSDDEQRLFGTPGAEVMHFDLASAYEEQVDAYFDEPRPDDDPWTIEEWTVRPPSSHLRRVDWFIEEQVEHIADDLGEGGYEAWENAADDDVKAAFQAAFDLWASKVTYVMADKLVRTHTVTWDADLTPLIDGEPLYHDKATT